jgi:protein-S-isoprenylcysteine O-methyltransferase Ste14
MSESDLFTYLLIGWLVLALITFLLLFFVTAPYGRYVRKGWGPLIPSTVGWIVMEFPSPLVFAWCFVSGVNQRTVVAYSFLLIWLIHYLHRSLIYPFLLRGNRKQMTLIPILLGMIFNVGNAYINGQFLYSLGPEYPTEWLWDPRFIVGVVVFVFGFLINKHSDHILRQLRKPGETGYKIPQGGLYQVVSCPNYLGEILEWSGWALATWTIAGLSFALWTIANLAPRALAHHRWYQKKFSDYPKQRKALVPYLL